MKALNAATPEQIAAFRAGTKRRSSPPRSFVRPTAISRPDGWELQLDLLVEAKQANRMWWQTYFSAGRQKYDVITTLCSMRKLTAERERIERVELTRLSPCTLDPDNLPGAFKAVLDAISVWFIEGEQALRRLSVSGKGNKRCSGKDLGRFDGKVFGTGRVTCHYAQLQHELDKRLHGIRIRFRLTPKSSTACTT